MKKLFTLTFPRFMAFVNEKNVYHVRDQPSSRRPCCDVLVDEAGLRKDRDGLGHAHVFRARFLIKIYLKKLKLKKFFGECHFFFSQKTVLREWYFGSPPCGIYKESPVIFASALIF